MAGRQVTSWGQLFGEFQLSHGSAFVPPVPPVPVEGGADAVALPGLPPGMLVSTTAYRRRSRLDDIPNPWVAILRWLRRIDATREWTADYGRQIELDDLEIIELTANSRNRSH